METDKIKEILTEKAKWWIHNMGIGFYSAKLNFNELVIREDRNGFTTYANCDADWRYLRFTITFYTSTMSDLDEDELEVVVVHELMHIFLNEMRNLD